jgi:hypothetical protein
MRSCRALARRNGRHVSACTSPGRRRRRGVVLVAVLALLALGAALIAGAFAAARGSARGTRSARAAVVATAAARRALARTMASWSAAENSLGIGGFSSRAYAESGSVAVDVADVQLRVHRLSATLYVVAAEARVPSTGAPIARRRARVLLERAPTIDSTVVQPIRPIARWASADLY